MPQFSQRIRLPIASWDCFSSGFKRGLEENRHTDLRLQLSDIEWSVVTTYQQETNETMTSTPTFARLTKES